MSSMKSVSWTSYIWHILIYVALLQNKVSNDIGHTCAGGGGSYETSVENQEGLLK